MKFSSIITTIAALAAPISVVAKSQDYARHIELSLLFYEAQRSGKLPENNRIFWRHDSLLESGADNGVDLNGGYYDAGDNVKFNFPGASTMTLLAWSGIDLADGYKEAGQYGYLLDAVRWGADYFMKCHTGKNELYVQVGEGNTDHSFWYPPEYIKYDYPSYKISASAPGSEVAGETAAFLTAASILFKDEDPDYAAKCLKHGKEIYDFADTYRGDYTAAVPGVTSFYSTYSGYNDELVWGAAWLYRATGDESYLEKYNKIANASYSPQDSKKYGGNTGPISWDDKRPGAYVLIAMLTNDEKRINEAYSYCDAIISQPRTPGGLWYDDALSIWGSNRYAANAASMVGMFANFLPKSDPKRAGYVEFVKSQIDYILGDNPAGVNYVVGAEENSPKGVHHRGSSGVFDSQDKAAKPDYNIFTLWGALAGGPGASDNYVDSRKDFQMNEVALDYNAGFQMNLAFLTKEGLSVPDPASVKEHERSFPKKADTPDVQISFEDGQFSVATGSGMLCAGWCVSFTSSSYSISQAHECTPVNLKGPDFTICNKRENNFLDGEGTPVVIKFQGSGSSLPDEFIFQCDGFHAPLSHQGYTYKPEWGRQYKVTNGGGVGNTIPLFEESECWPAFLCDGSAPKPTTSKKPTSTTTTKDQKPTTPVSDDCFAKAMGYSCCNDSDIMYSDADGDWGYANGDWCGIGGSSEILTPPPTCGDYACCSGCDIAYVDGDGNWGIENNDWCKISDEICKPTQPATCTGSSSGYKCCDHCDVSYTDAEGSWGVMNNEWCGISSDC